MQVYQEDSQTTTTAVAQLVATRAESAPGKSSNDENYIVYITRLLGLGQVMCKQKEGAVELLCKEIELITHGQAQLFLYHLKSCGKIHPSSLSNSIGFPVQFCDQLYGTLFVKTLVAETVELSLPFFVAQLLAQACSCLLFLFDQSLFLQYQFRRVDDLGPVTLTKREKEVLVLICQGYSEMAIAETLVIAPSTVTKHRQHIYEQLGVHCERDIPLAAYRVGLFSPLVDKV